MKYNSHLPDNSDGYAPETGKKIKRAQNPVCTQKAQFEQNFCS
jgi:hypothetical protein